MDRRQFIATAGLAGISTLTGCLSPPRAKASFTYQPANPVAGEPIVFDATSSKGEVFEWYFVDVEGDRTIRNGQMTTITTDSSGAFTAQLRVANSLEIMYADPCLASDLFGCSVDEDTKRVYVLPVSESESHQTGLNIETEKINLHLKGNDTNITTTETANLRFSSANLIGNRKLTIQLLLETTSGISVTSTAFIESGGGQYTSTFVLSPGESKGMGIQISPNSPGQHTVTGHAVYYFGNNTENRKSQSFKIPITVISA